MLYKLTEALQIASASKLTKPGVLALATIVVGACGDGLTRPDEGGFDLPPSELSLGEGASPQFFPVTAFGHICLGEVIDFTGFVHPVFQFTTDATGGIHYKGHFNADLIGIGRTTGSVWNWNDVQDEENNFRPPQETFQYHQHIELIGRGQAPNLLGRVLFRYTVTATGVVSVVIDNFLIECG